MKPAPYMTVAGRNPTKLGEKRSELRKSGYGPGRAGRRRWSALRATAAASIGLSSSRWRRGLRRRRRDSRPEAAPRGSALEEQARSSGPSQVVEGWRALAQETAFAAGEPLFVRERGSGCPANTELFCRRRRRQTGFNEFLSGGNRPRVERRAARCSAAFSHGGGRTVVRTVAVNAPGHYREIWLGAKRKAISRPATPAPG